MITVDDVHRALTTMFGGPTPLTAVLGGTAFSLPDSSTTATKAVRSVRGDHAARARCDPEGQTADLPNGVHCYPRPLEARGAGTRHRLRLIDVPASPVGGADEIIPD